jgi:hypothetical protein
VASIEEIISTLQQSQNAVNNAITACGAAMQKTTGLQGQLAAAGVRDKVQQLAAAKTEIEKYRAHLGASNELANRAVNLVKAVGG